MDAKTQTKKLTKQFEYLDTLRETGVTNMWGASSWLRNAFDIDQTEARRALGQWMDTFDGETPAFERAAAALAKAQAAS